MTNAKDSADYSSVITGLKELIPEQKEKNNIPGLSIALIEGLREQVGPSEVSELSWCLRTSFNIKSLY